MSVFYILSIVLSVLERFIEFSGEVVRRVLRFFVYVISEDSEVRKVFSWVIERGVGIEFRWFSFFIVSSESFRRERVGR